MVEEEFKVVVSCKPIEKGMICEIYKDEKRVGSYEVTREDKELTIRIRGKELKDLNID